MAKYTVLSNLHHNGEIYAPGDSVELDDKTADGLIKSNVIDEGKKKKADDKTADGQGKAE